MAIIQRLEDGTLPSVCSYSGADIVYLDDMGRTLSGDGANIHEAQGHQILVQSAYLEGPPIQCDETGAFLEPLYGSGSVEEF